MSHPFAASSIACKINDSLAYLDSRNLESHANEPTGLGLSNDIVALNDGHNGTLLDSRRALETAPIQ